MMFGVARNLPKYCAKSTSNTRQAQCGLMLLTAGATCVAAGILANPASEGSMRGGSHRVCWKEDGHQSTYRRLVNSSFFRSHGKMTACEGATSQQYAGHEEEERSPEEERFLDTLALYRRWILDIKNQWDISKPASIKWPNNIPDSSEISALEMDLRMYLKNQNNQEENRNVQDLEFRIASYYLFREQSKESQKKGFNMVKKLAVDGHPDGLCLYAMVWNHGGVAGMEAKPQMAVKYWRQAAEAGHLASMYELGVALYVGDGTLEDPAQAVQCFRNAANLGHSGAAYLLADCYLDGVGVPRDRSKAFEWLMTAAEMGHRQAQRRGEALLISGISTPQTVSPDAPPMASMSSASSKTKLDRGEKIRWNGNSPPSDWYRKVSLERRFTIGGGSRNPTILFRRKTNVAESRRSED